MFIYYLWTADSTKIKAILGNNNNNNNKTPRKVSKSKLYDFDCQAQKYPGMSNDFIIKQKKLIMLTQKKKKTELPPTDLSCKIAKANNTSHTDHKWYYQRTNKKNMFVWIENCYEAEKKNMHLPTEHLTKSTLQVSEKHQLKSNSTFLAWGVWYVHVLLCIVDAMSRNVSAKPPTSPAPKQGLQT